MRQTTREIIESFLEGVNHRIGNSEVKAEPGYADLYLHGNCIAVRDPDGISLNHQGWMSNGTKERLNGILEMLGKSEDRIYQVQGEWYWKGEKRFASGWNKI